MQIIYLHDAETQTEGLHLYCEGSYLKISCLCNGSCSPITPAASPDETSIFLLVIHPCSFSYFSISFFQDPNDAIPILPEEHGKEEHSRRVLILDIGTVPILPTLAAKRDICLSDLPTKDVPLLDLLVDTSFYNPYFYFPSSG